MPRHPVLTTSRQTQRRDAPTPNASLDRAFRGASENERNPMRVHFVQDQKDSQTIAAIAGRANAQLGLDRLLIEMDVSATHANGCPLRLSELLAADDWNFAHDVQGISKRLHRNNGRLPGWFVPRFAR
jgi:hypothetical protein